ncbi:hypothetical protein NKJ66_23380 [Mesorhizobium sp. M0078]|uniref:hypothetical protein n=1 Tax=Mesorhizobium sp. M0078 TaxID=2956871 RepID=UPI003335E961
MLAVKGLVFGDPNGLSREEQDINGRVLWAYAAANAEALGFNREHGKVSVPSFHPIFRLGEDGVLRIDMVVELIQKRKIAFDEASPELGAFEVNSGVTLMIANQPLKEGSRPDPVVRYVIPRHADDHRIRRQRTAYAVGAYMKDHRIDFSLVHGGQ